jgi:hypothetical protein
MKASGRWLTAATVLLTAVGTFLTLRVLHSTFFSKTYHDTSSANMAQPVPAISTAVSKTYHKYDKAEQSIDVGNPVVQQPALVTRTSAQYLARKDIPREIFLRQQQHSEHRTATGRLHDAFVSELHQGLHTCSPSIVAALKKPTLQQADIDWCKWATSPTGGGVMVGKSWGKLVKPADRTRFDSLNCNAVNSNNDNPTCDDAWGDNFVRKWKANRSGVKCDNPTTRSSLECYINDNNDKWCVMENVMIDFSKAQKVSKGSSQIASKKFAQDYISMDCHAGTTEPGFTLPHLLSPSRTASAMAVCDYVIEDTVLLFSHDNIRNMAHTLNDVMNVWLMLWMDGKAANTSSMPFLTIDALKMYNNFDDTVNQYFTTYAKNFRTILRGADFGTGTLCLRRVLTQPLPIRGFVWDNWHNDLPCSFVGPSSLYQRWNLHVRHSFGLLSAAVRETFAAQTLKVVLIVRTESKNDWGSYRTSRLFLNQQEIITAFEQLRGTLTGMQQFELVVQDFALLSFEQQMRLMSETNILVGMHGAGISQSQYMPIGSERCCGVLEIFPRGEFTPVRGFANMIRKMGLSYGRIDISKEDSLGDGARVPVAELVQKLRDLIVRVVKEPACVLPQVIDDPYLLSAT